MILKEHHLAIEALYQRSTTNHYTYTKQLFIALNAFKENSTTALISNISFLVSTPQEEQEFKHQFRFKKATKPYFSYCPP